MEYTLSNGEKVKDGDIVVAPQGSEYRIKRYSNIWTMISEADFPAQYDLDYYADKVKRKQK